MRKLMIVFAWLAWALALVAIEVTILMTHAMSKPAKWLATAGVLLSIALVLGTAADSRQD